MRRFAPLLVLAAACSAESMTTADAPSEIDAAIDGSLPDSASPCETDEFDGSTLASHWAVFQGGMPTYTVASSALTIANAPLATTPSMAGKSWIYDLDTDKGNQITWPRAIGGASFSITANVTWSSAAGEVTLGGIGVSDAQGVIAAYAGAIDASGTTSGRATARLRVAGAAVDQAFNAPITEPGTAKVRIERTNGTATIFIDDIVVLSGPMPALISNVVVIYVRHNNGTTTYPFGTFALQALTVCQ